jgi:hypothetical protein
MVGWREEFEDLWWSPRMRVVAEGRDGDPPPHASVVLFRTKPYSVL